MVVKGTAEQARTDGVAERAPLVCRILKVGFVRAEFHGLAATVELKRPGAGVNVGFKLELTGEAGSDGTDAFGGLVAGALGVDDGCLQTADGDGGLVDHINHDLDDVLIVVVDLHLDRRQMGVQGTCTGAVVITHSGSPVPTERWHYFNGLPFRVAINAIASGSQQAATSRRQPPCGACGQRPCGTLPRWNRRCTCRAGQSRANR